MLTVDQVAQMIDHSILLPAWTDDDLVKGIAIAKQYHVYCVAPKTYQIPRARELLRGTDIRLACPISFPAGPQPARDQAARGRVGAEERRRGAGHGAEHQ